MKIKVFIGSSSETLRVAESVANKLNAHGIESKVWTTTFEPSQYTLDDLTKNAKENDFAVFILGQDDKIESRGKLMNSPRDNVIYEAGLFAGYMDISNVFLLVDEDGTKIPTDWSGLTYLKYNSKDNKLLGDSCMSVVRVINNKIQNSVFKVDGYYWQFVINNDDGAIISFVKLEYEEKKIRLEGYSWDITGKFMAKYHSKIADLIDEKLIFYWEGDHPKEEKNDIFFGMGEINFKDQNDNSIIYGHYTGTNRNSLDKTVIKTTMFIKAQPIEIEEFKRGINSESFKEILQQRIKEREKERN